MKRLQATLSSICLLASAAPSQAATPTTITGVLIDERNQPAEDVPITSVSSDDHDYLAAIKTPLTRSLADGTFRVSVDVPEEGWPYLLIGGHRYALRRKLITRHTRHLDLGPLTLARGFRATGRIRDEDGKAVRNALVVGTDLLPTRRFMWQSINHDAPAHQTETIVRDRGIFLLPGMVRSAGLLTVSCAGYFDATVEPVAMGTPLDITLQKAPTVSGRAIDADGKPVAGARISLGRVTTESAEDGTFSLSPRSRKTLAISGRLTKDEQRLDAKATIIDYAAAIDLKFTARAIADKTGIRVRAVSADGKELKQFDAYSSWNPSNQMQYRPDAMLLTTAARKTGFHGSTDVGEVALPGKGNRNDDAVWIFARAAGHGWGKLQVDPKAHGGDPVTVKMTMPTTLRGRIVDENTGQPVAGVSIAPTQELSKNAKNLYAQGHFQVASLVGPDAVVTDADGKWQLDGVSPGELELFAIMDGRSMQAPRSIEVKAGEGVDEITFKIPNRATLKGKAKGNRVAGLQIRPHWHRPNMSSSAWATEYDRAVSIAADGSFAMPDLPPLLYQLQVVLPPPARGGMRQKLKLATWDGTAPPKEPWSDSYPQISLVEGRVNGEVPWSRLAVLAIAERTNTFFSQFAPPGTLALLGPDRTFRMLLPEQAVRMVLFDVLSGIAIEFRDIQAADINQPIVWSGRAHAITVHLRDRDAGAQQQCRIEYHPTEDHWPLRPHPAFQRRERNGMRMETVGGKDVSLWLPDRSGQLEFTVGKAKLQLQMDTVRETNLTIVLGDDAVARRQ